MDRLKERSIFDSMADLKDQMSMFWRSAVEQLDGVREAVEQTAKQGKVQLDIALLRRKKKDVLAQLGEAVAQAVRSGRLASSDYPELESLMAQLEDIEFRIANEDQ